MASFEQADMENRVMKSSITLMKSSADNFDDEDNAREPELEAADLSGPSTYVLVMKALLTFLVIPAALWFNAHAFLDITLNGRWDLFGDTWIHYIILVLLPCLSHLGCCYIIISFWMDEECHTVMRTRTMWATVPLLLFFTCQMMGQSTHYNWLDCSQEALVQQICYLQANLWQTATVFTAYRFIIKGLPKLQGTRHVLIHVACWGFPVLLTTLQTLVSPGAFHGDLFESELRGIGWCGVSSERRITKAVFVNIPQMISVSFYAQFYFYIHQKVDPEITQGFEQTAKLSTSQNARLLSLEEARKEIYIQDTAKQLRLQMSAYMLSFLTNTVVSLIGDNLTDPDTGASDLDLLVQTGVVTCQGLLMSLVYGRAVNKPLLTAYWDTAEDLIAMCSEQKAIALASKRARIKEKRAIKLQNSRRRKRQKPSILSNLVNCAVIFYQTFLLYPVAIWVWVPMEFISQNTDKKRAISICLMLWSVASVFPVYGFSLIGYRTSGMSQKHMENMAQVFALCLILVSAIAVYVNRYTHDLLMIERPCRYKGSLQRWFGPGQGFRFKSLRNSMSVFTLVLEFYQTWGLTWSATRMDDLYRGVYDSDHLAVASSGSGGEEIKECTVPTGHSCEIFQFWSVVAMVIGWVLLYSFPAVVTTSTVGNRQFAHNMQEMYRKYLWFMSGAGFLTVLKACMRILFCIPNPRDPTGPQVTLTDHTIVCMSDLHLQMIAISLLCLAFFFPSATLTALFRYDDEDERAFPPFIQNSCVLGGEDIRWIHLWRRVEYLVKGVWVFSGMRFAKSGNLSCVVLLLGSLVIATANYFMNPSNLRYVNRQKLNIHVCNAWTTLTCLWAATVYNDNRTQHNIMMFAGWIIIWLVLWGYEAYMARLNPYRKEVGDKENLEYCQSLIKSYKNYIMQAKGMYRWGNHSKIVEILNLCEHHDIEIQRAGFNAICDLAFCDQMSRRYSFFLNLTSTSPTVNMMIDAIETSPDSDIQNLATRALNSFLQTNTSNTYGVFVSFHATIQVYDEAKDGMIASIISKYAVGTESTNDQIDAIQLALEMCQSDSNDIPAVAECILPTLNEWMKNGTIIKQYLAAEVIMYCANRFDCAQYVCSEIGVDAMISLFQQVCDSYGQFQGNDSGSSSPFMGKFGYRDGESNVAPRSFRCLRRSLPKKFKRMDNLKVDGDPTTDKNGDEMLGVTEETTLNETHLRIMQADILSFIVNTLVDCTFAANGDVKKEILDSNVLEIVVQRCLEFDAAGRADADAVDRDITTELHVEACRLVEYLLSHGFNLGDIHHDDEMVDYLHQLKHFMEDEDMQDVEVHAFDQLTNLQRRKAHLVAEFLALEHISDGPPGRRVVLVRKPEFTQALNPSFDSQGTKKSHVQENLTFKRKKKGVRASQAKGMNVVRSMDLSSDGIMGKTTSIDSIEAEMKKERAAAAAAVGTKKLVELKSKPEDLKGTLSKDLTATGAVTEADVQIFSDNLTRVAEFGVVQLLIDLSNRTSTASQVAYSVYDIFLLLLEHDGLGAEHPDLATVKQMLLDGILHPSRGISVMCCTGAHIILLKSGTYIRYGERALTFKGKNLFRKMAKLIYWMVFWKLRAKRGHRKAVDFSDIELESGSV